MIRLGVLVVVLLGVLLILLLVRQTIVRPAMRRRHLADLEAENARLDALLTPRPTARETRR